MFLSASWLPSLLRAAVTTETGNIRVRYWRYWRYWGPNLPAFDYIYETNQRWYMHVSHWLCMHQACIHSRYIYIYIYIYMLIAGFLLQLHFLCAGWAQPDVSTVRAGVGTCSALMPRGQWVRYSTCVTRPHGPEVYARSRVPNRDHQHTTPTGKTLNIHIFKSTHIYIYIYMLMSCRSYK